MKLRAKDILKSFRNIWITLKNFVKFFNVKNVNDKKILYNAKDKLRIELDKRGKLFLKSPCFTNDGSCKLCVRDGAVLSIGSSTFFNSNCIIVAREKITVGDNCLFGPNVYICDHDHEYNKEKVFTDKFITKPVSVGDGSWIGAGCIILKGSSIGKNCIIGAGSVITGNIPDYSIVIQKRNSVINERI